jgi:broad specificity phosphatase PhoE
MLRLIFTFVRHGQTQDNRNGILAGHTDTPLNSLGKRQAAAVALSPTLKETPFAYAFGSDLSRAVEVSFVIS